MMFDDVLCARNIVFLRAQDPERKREEREREETERVRERVK